MFKFPQASKNDIKLVKSLHFRRKREAHGLFFAEGLKIAQEALWYCRDDIEFILADEEFCKIPTNNTWLLAVDSKNIKVYETDSKTFDSVSDASAPQGIITVIRIKNNENDIIFKEQNNFILLLDSIQDPGNVGTIIRTADAANADAVVISKGCADIYNPKVIRSTMGSLFHIPVIYHKNLPECITGLKKNGFRIIASHLDGEKYHYDEKYGGNIAMVVGNESKGISDEIKQLADVLVKIPMPGKAESLNVSVASGILTYEILRQRQEN